MSSPAQYQTLLLHQLRSLHNVAAPREAVSLEQVVQQFDQLGSALDEHVASSEMERVMQALEGQLAGDETLTNGSRKFVRMAVRPGPSTMYQSLLL